MRTLPEGMQAHLDSGATTLCHCWKLTRADGLVLGFTDHDNDLAFAGTVYEAGSGFEASEIQSSLGLSIDNLDASGALTSEALGEDALAAGLFDNAEIEIHLVNWADTAQHLLLRKGNIGEVSRSDRAFTAEVRGRAHRLNQPFGRAYTYACDADLGDAACGIDLDDPDYRGAGAVAEAEDRRRFRATGLDGFANGWFERGRLAWTSGANAGLAMEVKVHRAGAAGVHLELWQPMARAIAPGDGFTVTAGCDKQFATCRDRFDNAVNFRGFHMMPGTDFVLSYPSTGDPGNDGESRA